MLRYLIALPALIALTACGAPARNTPQPGAGGAGPMQTTAAGVHCQRSGGTVIERVSAGQRADLCRLPGGRTVRAADLLNSHNNL
ncbi:MAG: hypothetical protein Q4G26_09220 [Paracoccus sp. (in: a-proteobacteria)]|nr:hypothetical protein [Paracoccus sp. (in: a-proteobacteria)]